MVRSFEEVSKEEIRDLLGKGWLTHDGMWFYTISNEYGVNVANKMNKAAIKAMVPIEVQRLKQVLAFDSDRLANVNEVMSFLKEGMRIILPLSVFSKFRFSSTSPNTLSWEWEKNECFAYKGMSRIGVIDKYECGVMYRIECWFESLGLTFESNFDMDRCQMHLKGFCRGEYIFHF